MRDKTKQLDNMYNLLQILEYLSFVILYSLDTQRYLKTKKTNCALFGGTLIWIRVDLRFKHMMSITDI
jgi:hypothetical protein